jgi:hypothetical protein
MVDFKHKSTTHQAAHLFSHFHRPSIDWKGVPKEFRPTLTRILIMLIKDYHERTSALIDGIEGDLQRTPKQARVDSPESPKFDDATEITIATFLSSPELK